MEKYVLSEELKKELKTQVRKELEKGVENGAASSGKGHHAAVKVCFISGWNCRNNGSCRGSTQKNTWEVPTIFPVSLLVAY